MAAATTMRLTLIIKSKIAARRHGVRPPARQPRPVEQLRALLGPGDDSQAESDADKRAESMVRQCEGAEAERAKLEAELSAGAGAVVWVRSRVPLALRGELPEGEPRARGGA